MKKPDSYPSDAENTELKAMATKISLHVSLPDSGSFENGQQVSFFSSVLISDCL